MINGDEAYLFGPTEHDTRMADFLKKYKSYWEQKDQEKKEKDAQLSVLGTYLGLRQAGLQARADADELDPRDTNGIYTKVFRPMILLRERGDELRSIIGDGKTFEFSGEEMRISKEDLNELEGFVEYLDLCMKSYSLHPGYNRMAQEENALFGRFMSYFSK